MNSKKAYILAFQRATNYGAVLQILALKTILERLGLEVQVIDYVPDWMQVKLKNQPTIKSYLKRKIMNYTFKSFFEELNLTKKTFYDNKTLKKYLQDGKFYFVGSDQVWNEKIMKKDITYFLNFSPENSIKIAYAASMGNNHLSDDFKKKVSILLNKFNFISVREQFVSDYVKKETNKIDIPVVLDPTLLLVEKDYSRVTSNKKYNQDFIALYAAMHDPNLYNFAKYLSKKTNLPIINLGYHFDGADKQEYIYGPSNWLNRVKESKYFITNSFHGTVFSVLFKKNFFVVPNQDSLHSGLNARFTELLSSISLSERLVYNNNDIDNIINQSIDYEQAFVLLEKRRKESMHFIEEAIKIK